MFPVPGWCAAFPMALENYAALLRVTARVDEAERMEARAKAIRAKHAEANPAQ